MIEKVFLAVIRFYEHNDPLVFLVPLIIISIGSLIFKPRRRGVFFLLGVLLLLLQFEYTKVIFKEVKIDWVNQIFAADFQLRKAQMATFLLQEVTPICLSVAGWGFLALAALI
ncbi:MAG: hypothetical protein M1352_03435 [Patescibacteria group bacterium]|nr:hypothetical protein [Patescibacteria group bacterium]